MKNANYGVTSVPRRWIFLERGLACLKKTIKKESVCGFPYAFL